MVVTCKPQHLGAAGNSTCDANRKQVHLGPAQTNADVLHPGHGPDESFCELRLETILACEELSCVERSPDRLGDRRVVVAEDHRSHPSGVVDVLVAIDIPQPCADRSVERERHWCARQSDVGVHTPCDHLTASGVLGDAGGIVRGVLGW